MPHPIGKPAWLSRQSLLYWGLLLIVLLAAAWPFLDVLNYYFTKTDTVAIIYSSRLSSLQDLTRILTNPVKSLTAREIYYRPVTSLSFGLNHLFGGLEPFGYHLTNLAIHSLVGGLLFHFVYRLNGRDLPAAFLSAMLYTLHPVLIEVMPMLPYRQVTLTTLFLLAGLSTFLSYEFGTGGRSMLILSLGCFLLALGTKEMGIIYLPMIFLLLVLFQKRGEPWKNWILHLLRRLTPYGLVATLYVLLWGYVTQWRVFMGGGTRIAPTLFRRNVVRTLKYLIYGGFTTNIPFYFGVLFEPFSPLYSIVTPALRGGRKILEGYESGGTPVGLVVSLLCVSVVVCLMLLVWTMRRQCLQGLRRALKILSHPSWRVGWFYLGWMLIPGIVFALGRIMDHDNVYFGIPPLSALMATLLVGSARRATPSFERFYEAGMARDERRTTGLSGRLGYVFTTVLTAGLIVSTVVKSPWLNREFEKVYGPVQMGHKRYMKALHPVLSSLPDGSKIRLLDVPFWFHPIFYQSPLPRSGHKGLLLRYDLLIKMMADETITLVGGSARFFRSTDPDPNISIEVRKKPDGIYDLVARVEDLSQEPFKIHRIRIGPDGITRKTVEP